MKNKGFSLVEIMVVVGIIGLLVAGALISFSGQRASARDARRVQDIDNIKTALEIYINDHTVPKNDDDGTTGWDLSSVGGFVSFLKTEGYMSKTPVDPINSCTETDMSLYCYRYHYYETSGAGGVDVTVNGVAHKTYALEASKMEGSTPRPAYNEPVIPR